MKFKKFRLSRRQFTVTMLLSGSHILFLGVSVGAGLPYLKIYLLGGYCKLPHTQTLSFLR